MTPNKSEDLGECAGLLPLTQDAPAQTYAASSTLPTVAAASLGAGMAFLTSQMLMLLSPNCCLLQLHF